MPSFFSAWVTFLASKAWLVTERRFLRIQFHCTPPIKLSSRELNQIFEYSLKSSQSSWCNFPHSSILRVIKLSGVYYLAQSCTTFSGLVATGLYILKVFIDLSAVLPFLAIALYSQIYKAIMVISIASLFFLFCNITLLLNFYS